MAAQLIDGKEVAKTIEAEVAAVLKPICDALTRIGGISAGPEPDGFAPLYLIITAAGWDLPLADHHRLVCSALDDCPVNGLGLDSDAQ